MPKSVCLCDITAGVCEEKACVPLPLWGQTQRQNGAPGEIAAKKAAEECVAISGMTGRGCPAPVIWKVLHLSLGPRHWPTNSTRQISIM